MPYLHSRNHRDRVKGANIPIREGKTIAKGEQGDSRSLEDIVIQVGTTVGTVIAIGTETGIAIATGIETGIAIVEHEDPALAEVVEVAEARAEEAIALMEPVRVVDEKMIERQSGEDSVMTIRRTMGHFGL